MYDSIDDSVCPNLGLALSWRGILAKFGKFEAFFKITATLKYKKSNLNL
jgi:hypothetical protein